MIVEFLGPAGSGKTTLAHALSKRLQARGYASRVALTYQPGDNSSGLNAGGVLSAAGRVTKAVVRTIGMACRPFANARSFRIATGLVKTLPPEKLIWRVRLGQYILRLTQVWSGCRSDEIVIFDQGFVQALCSLALFNREADDSALLSAVASIPESDMVIQVSAPQSMLDARLRDRIRSESIMERLFEADLDMNLKAAPIVERVSALLRARGRLIMRVSTLDQQSFLEALDVIELAVLAKIDDEQDTAAKPRANDANESPVRAIPDVSSGYRGSHQSPGYGASYEGTYESGYYAALWRKIERPMLETILRPMGGEDRKWLDFACGTGRIANMAAPYFGEAVAVDVSASMLESARVPQHVRLRHIDITADDLGEEFDVVTAFRFFLNAEDDLKRDALHAIRRHLRDHGRLVCNIHMNASSPMGLLYRVTNKLPSGRVQNTLCFDHFARFLYDAGFEIEETRAYGFLPRPGRFFPRLCEFLIEPTEKVSRALGVPARYAQSFLVVAKKRELALDHK